MMETLDNEHIDITETTVTELFKFLNDKIKPSEKYTYMNLCINVLVGALSTISYNYLNLDDEERFVETIALLLKENQEFQRPFKIKMIEERKDG